MTRGSKNTSGRPNKRGASAGKGGSPNSRSTRTTKPGNEGSGKWARKKAQRREETQDSYDASKGQNRPNLGPKKGRRPETKEPSEGVRLNKFLANAGVASRREADTFIESGLVSINGKVVTQMGYKVMPTDEVKYAGESIQSEKKVYLLLNKPKGFLTTMDDPKARKTVMDLVGSACKERIYPVGRLDRATTGVLLFTNDGDMAKKLTHPSHGAKKIYQVTLDKKVAKGDLIKIMNGFELEDGFVKADEVSYIEGKDRNHVGIEIHQGRNRIVRRIFSHLGYDVTKLDRVYFAGLTKKNLSRGDYRFLSPKEIDFLRTR